MKLYQLPGYGFPGLHAESFQVSRMSEAFLDCDLNVTLAYPWSSRKISWRDVPTTYGLHRSLRRKILPGLHLTSSRLQYVSRPLLRLSLALFAILAGRDGIFLGRHTQAEPLATLVRLKAGNLLKAPIFVELHEPHHYSASTDPYVDGYIVVSRPLKGYLLEAGVPANKILLAPNAVDLASYETAHRFQRAELRETLGLHETHPVICYTGQLGPGRNVESLIEAMTYLNNNATLVLVGGKNSNDIDRLQRFAAANNLAERVRLVGQQPTEITIHYQLASDVLAIPYNLNLSTSKWFSPLKLGEYLAAGKPIVAFRVPALDNILRDDEVVWAKEETASALAAAIKEALKRSPRSSNEIRARLGEWTWKDRARRVLDFIENLRGVEPQAQ